MAENTIATAYVQLVASADGMQDSISEAMGGTGNSSGKSFGSTFLTSAAAVIAAGAATIASAATAIWKTATDTAAAGDTIAKTSVQLGIATDEYQTLAFAAEHCGFSVETFTTATRSLQNSGFDGSLYDALNAVMSLDDATERTAMATELFGTRSAMAMANLLEGETTLDDFMSQLDELGGMMSEEAVADSATFQDSLTNVQTAIQGTVNELAATMLPGLSQVMDGLAGLFSGSDGADAQISEGIASLTNTFKTLIPKLTKLITTLAPQLISAAGELILALASGLVQALPEMMPSLMEVVLGIASMLLELIPTIAEVGLALITELLNGIASALPTLLPSLVETIIQFINTIVDNLPTILEAVLAVITTLFDLVFNEVLPMLLAELPSIITGLIDFIVGAIPQIIDALISIVMAIVENLPTIILALVDALPQIIAAIVAGLLKCVMQLVAGAIELVLGIVLHLPEIIMALIEAIPEIVVEIVKAFADQAPALIEAGKEMFAKIKNGILDFGTKIKEIATNIVTEIKTRFSEKFETMKDIGKNLIQGLIDGVKNMASNAVSAVSDVASDIADTFKDFFGIASPSKLFYSYGNFIDEGLVNGLSAGQGDVEDAMDSLNGAIVSDYSNGTISPMNHSAISTDVTSESASLIDLLSKYLPMIADGQNVNVTLEGDAKGVFDLVRNENRNYIKSNGMSAFVY